MKVHTTRRGLLPALVVSLLMLGWGATASAADGVKLKVMVIHATKSGKAVDPKLGRIKKSLLQAFGGYTSFKQLELKTLKLAPNKAGVVTLPNKQEAQFTYKGEDKGQYRIKFSVPASKVDVELRARAKKVFYQAGFRHQGGLLILALYLKAE